MKCAVAYFFLLVHVANIKTLAKSVAGVLDNNYDVEEFISKLLTSRKFDELADKVAEKAVAKIKNLDHQTQTKRARDDYHQEEESHSNVYKNILRDGKETNDKLFKLDPSSILKDSFSDTDPLSLNYKYLTRSAQEKKDGEVFTKASDEEVIIEPDISKEEEKGKNKPKQEQNKGKNGLENKQQSGKSKDAKQGGEREKELLKLQMQQEAKARQLRKIEKGRMSQNIAPKFKAVESKEDVKKEPEAEEVILEETTEDSVEDTELQEPAEDSHIEANETLKTDSSEKKPTAEITSDYDINKKNEISGDETKELNVKNAVKTVETPTKSPTTLITDKNTKFYAEIQDSVQKSMEIIDEGSEGETTTVTTTKEVRIEGDKVYTFVENPEYAEYHEQFDKEKAKAKKPEDFL